jgi:hypothetical protein
MRGEACTPVGKAWCAQYSLGKSRTYSNMRYGEDIAGIWVTERARRMQWFYDMYVDAGVLAFEYTLEHVPPLDDGEFKIVLDGMTLGSHAGDAARALVNLRPT